MKVGCYFNKYVYKREKEKGERGEGGKIEKSEDDRFSALSMIKYPRFENDIFYNSTSTRLECARLHNAYGNLRTRTG